MTVDELEILITARVESAREDIKKFISDVKQELSSLSKSTNGLDLSQTKTNIEPIVTQVNKAKDKISEIPEKLKSSLSQTKDTELIPTESYESQIEYIKVQIEEIKKLLQQADMGYEVGDTMQLESKLEQLQNKLRNLTEKQNKIDVDVEDNGAEKKVNLLSKGLSGLKSVAKTVGSKISSALKSAGTTIKNLASKVKSFGKSTNNTFSDGIKSIKKFALSLVSVRSAFSLVSKAMQSYLSYDTELSNSIQNCWNVLGSLLAPVLEVIVSLFSKAVSYVNAFVTALTGINLVAKANTKALNNQSSAAQNTTSSLDELHTINDSSSSDDSSNNSITVEDVDLNSLLDKIFNYDWYSVGMELGKKINDALASIPWDFIQKLAVALATDLGDLVNGLVDGLDWSLLGTTIGNGIKTALLFVYTLLTTINFENIGSGIATLLNNAINTALGDGLLGATIANGINAAINTVYGFVTTFKWSDFGTTMATNLKSAISGIEWGTLAQTISEGIKGIFDAITSFIQNWDWQVVIDAIIEFITNIDWGGISSSIFALLGSALASLINLGMVIGNYIKKAFTNIVGYFQDEAEKCGGDIVGGLLLGIVDALVGIRNWIYENIFQPFINGFKKIFEINSPSTVMKEMGGYIIDGLKNGITGIWDKVKSIFTDLKNKIGEKFTEIKTAVTEKISSAKEKVTETFSSMKTTISNTATNLKSTLSTKFDSIKTSMTSTFSSLKTSASTWGKDICSNLASGISKAKDTVTSAVSSVASKIKDLLGFSEPDIGPLSDFHTYMPDMMELMAKGIHSNVSEVTKELESLGESMSYTITSNTPNLVDESSLLTQSVGLTTTASVDNTPFKEILNDAIVESMAIASSSNDSTNKIEVEVYGKTEVDGDKLVVVYDKAKSNKGYQGSSNTKFAY